MTELDATHDGAARSWLAAANAVGDFPLQNLPFSVFRLRASTEAFRGGVAIGDQIVDLAALARSGLLHGSAAQAAAACAQNRLNAFFDLGPAAWRALRQALFALLKDDAPSATQAALGACLLPQAQAEHALPLQIGDYTDFYTSLDHALNIGRLFRPDDPLSPNFHWMPIAYHGRVSSIGVSGQRVRRPLGQWLADGAAEPAFGASRRLDYELELGIYIGSGNAQGEPIALAQAEAHVFGVCLLNDWSARDIQRWESTPLGPFLAKNFATTVSPWIVTMDALAPYRVAWPRAVQAPALLHYLEDADNRHSGALDIQLEVWLDTARQREHGGAAERLSRTSFRHQHWTLAQMVAHHTVGGCNLQGGDLLGSGTISGPGEGEAGALIELTQSGRKPLELGNGERRGFLEDGDAVLLKGWCEKPGFARIGLGECRGQVVAARSAAGG
ncbi:MAG TPA: fumarylacetoacetase [Variovorax sp.]